MTTEASLQPNAVLRLNYSALSAHFINLIGNQPSSEHVNTINARLLDRIYGESLPPIVYKIWLPLALKHSPHLLVQAVHDPVSHHVRAIGIRQLARVARSSSWKTRGWDILGNAEGIRDIVRDLSINEISDLLDAIAQSIHRPEDSLSTHVEELFRLLQQDKSSRPLRHHLDTLLPLCGSPFVESVLSSLPQAQLTPQLLIKISQRHPALLRRIATGQVTVSDYAQKYVTERCARAMISSSDPYTAAWYEPGSASVLPGVCFTVDLFHMMAQKNGSKLKPSSINAYVHESLRHICRQKAAFNQVYFLMEKILPLIAIDGLRDLSELLVAELIRCWSIASFGTATKTKSPLEKLPHPQHPSRPSEDDKDRLVGLLTETLERCPMKPSQNRVSSLLHTIQKVLKTIASPARLPFLKILCHHSDLQIDLDSVPSEREKKMLPLWPRGVMELLPAADIRLLFDRMRLINGSSEYIAVADGEDSILSWSSQCQLMARCEAAVAITDDDLPKTKAGTTSEPNSEASLTSIGISEMKTRATKSKDPAMRLHWASKAVETALVSGSLASFHEVIEWSTRFMRDSVRLSCNLPSGGTNSCAGCISRSNGNPSSRQQFIIITGMC